MKKLLLTLATLLAASGSLLAINPAEFSKDPVVPPEGLVTKPYQWEWIRAYTPDDQRVVMKSVAVGFTDTEVYVQGICDDYPHAWVKGAIEGDKIIMKSGQYFGNDLILGYEFFFCAGNITYAYDEQGTLIGADLNAKDEMVFDYDAEAGTFETKDDFIEIQYDPYYETEELRFWEYYLAPKARPLELVGEAPKDPRITFVEAYEQERNCGYTVVIMENIGVNGAFLDPEKMYYNIYVNGELYVFSADLYGLPFDTSDIPYLFNNWDSISNESQNYFFTIYEPYNKFGAQLHYELDGVTYSSNLVETELSGIDTLAADAEPQTEEYYTLTGVRVAAPAPGLYIKVARAADGTTTATKTLLK